MSTAGTVRRIVKAYIDQGGAKMDEAHYQDYKNALLLGYLETHAYFDVNGENGLRCTAEGCGFGTAIIGEAIAYLRIHRPDGFRC
jgi:hypothetical protein